MGATDTVLQPTQRPAVSSLMKNALLACAATFVVATPAIAQDEDDYRVRIGLGGQIQPKFIGSDDTRILPLVDFDLARGTNPFPFEAPDDSFGIKLISKGGFAAGPAANIQSKRKESDVGAPVGKVSTTIEVGGFAEYHLSDSFRLRADVRKGLGGHDGLVGSLGADYIWRDGDRYVFSIGPRVLAANARFQRAYFGVDSDCRFGIRSAGLPAERRHLRLGRRRAGCPTSSIRASGCSAMRATSGWSATPRNRPSFAGWDHAISFQAVWG